MNQAPPRLEGYLAPEDVLRTAEELIPLLYSDLRRIAHFERIRVGAHDAMQTTALVHDAYLRLRTSPAFNDRPHFLRSAALAMRHVLINAARDSTAHKRGGGATHVPLDDNAEAIEAPIQMEADETVLAVHEALKQLAELNERLVQVVECRFFAGYSTTETAEALGLTERTVHRDWVKARAWLRRTLEVALD